MCTCTEYYILQILGYRTHHYITEHANEISREHSLDIVGYSNWRWVRYTLHISLATTFRILHSYIAGSCSEIINSKLQFKIFLINPKPREYYCQGKIIKGKVYIVFLPGPPKAGVHSMTETNGKYIYSNSIILLSHSYC